MDTPTLQSEVARFFPNDYTPETWKDLLPALVDQYQKKYQDQLTAYRLTLPDEPSPCQLHPPLYPMLPDEFSEACELLAQSRDFTYRALAACLYMDKNRINQLQQAVDQLIELCKNSQELNEEFARQIQAIKDSMLPRSREN
ncbi:MAG: hypothetical protein JWP57_3709 [Spirosoma sp.]|nr:hypothetical protein [Spirosoma sp.]